MGLINDAAKAFIEAGKGNIEKLNERAHVRTGNKDYNNDGKVSIFEKAKAAIAGKAYPAEDKLNKAMTQFNTLSEIDKINKEIKQIKEISNKPLEASAPKLSGN